MPPEQNSTGVTLPYEKQAMRGEPMPAGLTFPDQLLYQALALLYARYRAKNISREQAQKEKQSLLREHETTKYKWSLGGHWASVLKNTELTCSAYRKNRTLDNADKLVQALEGVLPNG